MKRAFAWFLSSLALIFLAAFPFGSWLFRTAVYHARIEATAVNIESILPKIEADLKAIAERNPFENGSRLRNAAPFILQHVALVDDSISRFSTPSHQLLRGLFDQYPHWTSDSEQADAFLKSPDLAKIDTAFMVELESFDHINVATEEPLRSRLAQIPRLGSIDRIALSASLPALDTIELMKFATVHVVQAITDKNRRLALGRMHKLAMLFQSDGTLVGQMAALAMLGRERWLVEKYGVKDWPTFKAEDLATIRRVSWVWPGLFRMAESREFPKSLRPFIERRFGACAGVTESTIAGLDQLFDFFEPTVPLEGDFAVDLRRSRESKRLALEKCDQREWLPLLVAPVDDIERLGRPGGKTVPPWLRHIPYVRRIVGMLWNSVAVPDSTKLYKVE